MHMTPGSDMRATAAQVTFELRETRKACRILQSTAVKAGERQEREQAERDAELVQRRRRRAKARDAADPAPALEDHGLLDGDTPMPQHLMDMVESTMTAISGKLEAKAEFAAWHPDCEDAEVPGTLAANWMPVHHQDYECPSRWEEWWQDHAAYSVAMGKWARRAQRAAKRRAIRIAHRARSHHFTMGRFDIFADTSGVLPSGSPSG
jgi:hypothetical protein